MNFLVDAHLPRSLADLLTSAGHDAIHTSDLLLGNRTTDAEINRLSLDEERVVVTKDEDFVDSHLIKGEPHKLLLVSTGNIGNRDLLELFNRNLGQIVDALADHAYVEVSRRHLTIHQ
jgi:predicted nuclease of predicted toxin-antitoxin system